MLYQLFCDALAIEKSARDDFLKSACKGDKALLAQVKLMLADDELNSSDNGNVTWSALGQSPVSEFNEQLIGVTINAFTIVELLGQGGMGSVYLAERLDKKFEQKVAIKIIHNYFDELIGKQPLIREASYMARLNHPNIGKVFDAGVSESGLNFIIMEYIEGVDFKAYIAQTSTELTGALRVFVDLCSAVQHAHQHQVVHADLKPENILVDHYQQVKVLDFGVSRLFDSRESKNSPILIDYLTAMTKEFAAPEQLQGAAASVLTDVYALGKILHLIVKRFCENCSRNDCKELQSIVNKAITLAPSQRYTSVDLLCSDVVRFQRKKIPTAFACSRWYRWQKLCLVRHPYLFSFVLVFLFASVFFITQLLQQNAQIAQEKSQSDAVVSGVEDILRLSHREKLKSNNLSAVTFLENAYQILTKDINADITVKSRIALILAETLLSQSKEALAEQIYIDTINSTRALSDKSLVIKAGTGLAKMYRTTVAYAPLGTQHLEKIFPFINTQQPATVEHAIFYLEYLRFKAMETKDDDEFVAKEQQLIRYISSHFIEQLSKEQQLDITLTQVKNDFYRLSAGGNVIFEGVEEQHFNQNFKPVLSQGLERLQKSMRLIPLDDVVRRAEYTLWQARLTYELTGTIPAEQLALRALELYQQSLGERHPETIRVYFVLYLITELEQPMKAFYYIKQAKQFINKDSSQLSIWSCLYLDNLLMTGQYKLFQNASFTINDLLAQDISGFNFVVSLYLYDYIDHFNFVPFDAIRLLYKNSLKEELLNSRPIGNVVEITKKVATYAKSDNIINTRIAEIEAKMNSVSADELDYTTKLHYAWFLSVAGDTDNAVKYMNNLQPSAYSSREKRHSHYLFFQLLQRARIYLNANQTSKANTEIMAAEVILSRLSLPLNNGFLAELLVLKSELAYLQGNKALAKQIFAEAKPIVELQFPAKSWLAEHVDRLSTQYYF